MSNIFLKLFLANVVVLMNVYEVIDHFPEVRKTIDMPKGAKKEIVDYKLTRYACYLIVQNGDPRKEVIAFGQTYFAIQTRRAEVADVFNQLDESNRIQYTVEIEGKKRFMFFESDRWFMEQR